MLELKILCKFFLAGEGNKEIVGLYNSMKIYWALTRKLEKDFQNSETFFCKLFTVQGGMCGHIWYLSDRRVAEPHEQARSRQASVR